MVNLKKKKSNQREGSEMLLLGKVRVSINICQSTIKCYGHVKAHRVCWSAQWEYDILHCAGPHSGPCRQLQKNLTVRKNSLRAETAQQSPTHDVINVALPYPLGEHSA